MAALFNVQKRLFSRRKRYTQPSVGYPKQGKAGVVEMRLAEVLTIVLEDTGVIVVRFMQHFSAEIEPMKQT